VTGAVLADESAYDALRTGPGWKPSYFIDECAPLSALIADRGRYATRVSRDPARTAATLFHEALVGAGVEMGKRSRRVLDAPDTAFPLAQDLSEPLSAIVRVMGRDSDNFLAEMLLKQLGEALGERGTTAAGARVVVETLADAGVPLAGVRVADGSGLSLLDRTTAAALVAILRAGLVDPGVRGAFLDSLAVAGVDGTLRHRMESRPARSRVIAKTGTTSRASALAGFVRDRYVFAVVQNGSPVSSVWSRRAQDRFATVLAGA
jgi:PBP4 family serine-type D-alanyl-D-alanine carboxypeptidase